MPLSVDFYVGTALSIPLALIAWLIQRKLDPWLSQRSAKSRLKRNRKLREEYTFILALHEGKSALSEYMMLILLKIISIVVGAILAIYLTFGVGFILSARPVAQFVDTFLGKLSSWTLDQISRYVIEPVFSLTAFVIFLAVAMYVLRQASSGVNTYYKVKNFAAYESSILSQMDKRSNTNSQGKLEGSPESSP
jgi:predicted MFS family arabinose efflux permease